MASRCPFYPAPVRSRWTLWWRRLTQRGNLLAQLTENAYVMHMGRRRFGRHALRIVNDPDAVRAVLVEQAAHYPKHRYMHDLLQPLLGQSIFTTNGETWQRQRRMVEPAFEHTRMDHAFAPMRQAVLELHGRLAPLADGREVNIEHETAHVTADVIMRTIFSLPLARDDSQAVFAAFARYQRDAPAATMPRYRQRWWPDFGAGARARHAALEIRTLLERLVAPRHSAFHAGQDGQEPDILASLLAAKDPDTGQPMGVTELVNEIAVLFLAGHETSSSALAWALYLLAEAPEVQQRAATEVATVLVAEALPTLAQLRDLDLVRRVVRETLRLYPPLGFLVREADDAGCLRQQPTEAGETVVVSPWLIHRHRRLWDRPDEFDPDRFLTPEGRQSSAKAYLPFSTGPRVCVGANFAMQEAVLVLAMVLRHFRVLPVPGRPPEPEARLSLRSRHGVWIRLVPRTAPAA
jgi:cytochrome P450